MFQKMQVSLETIANKSDSASSSKTSSSNPSPNSPPNPPQPKDIKKGIMFSSSISLDSDLNLYKEELNCDLKIIPTHYIEENPSSRDPDAYLQCMINKHLVGKPEYDFAIIATRSNDISDLESDNSPPTTLFQKSSDQSKLLVEVAEALTLSEGIDVLILEKPPRYDPPTNDSTCMKHDTGRCKLPSLRSG